MARKNLQKSQFRFPQNTANRDALYNKLLEHDQTLDSMSGDGLTAAGVSEVLSANGALSLTVPHSDLQVSGTMAFTIAAGTKIGANKSAGCTSAASTPSGVLTGAFTYGGVAKTTITFSAAGQYVTMTWNGAAYVVKLLIGAAIA